MAAKDPERRVLAWLHQILVLSVVLASAGACRVQEDGRQSEVSSGDNRIDTEMAKTVDGKWAERLDLPGVPNLYKVSDDLYRGAQPSAEGMRQLEKLGIKTIVNLRFIISDRNKIKGTELDYEHINVATFWVRNSDTVRFLKIVADSRRTPVFVHCHHGIDRAGAMCAVYRMLIQGWSKEQAIEEMTQGGFAHRSVYSGVVNYIRRLDLDQIRHRAGLSE